MTIMVGNAIEFPKLGEEISKEEVDKYHKMVSDAFVKLFEENKGKYALDGEKAKLEMF
jgi:hypothetical protein